MRIATSTNLFEYVDRNTAALYYTTEQSLEEIATAGFEAADLCFYNCCGEGHPFLEPSGWEGWADGLGQWADDLGLPLNQAHAAIVSSSQLQKKEPLIFRSIEAAGRLNIPWLVIHPYTVRDAVWYSHAASLAATREAFSRYLEAASRRGVGLCIENLAENRQGGRTFGASTEDLLEVIHAVGEDALGVCWDTGHGNLNGLDQPAALAQLGGKLKALHVNDNLGDRDAHLAPYMGNIQWKAVLRTLREIGYTGDFTYEIQGYTNALPAARHHRAAAELAELAREMRQAYLDGEFTNKGKVK